MNRARQLRENLADIYNCLMVEMLQVYETITLFINDLLHKCVSMWSEPSSSAPLLVHELLCTTSRAGSVPNDALHSKQISVNEQFSIFCRSCFIFPRSFLLLNCSMGSLTFKSVEKRTFMKILIVENNLLSGLLCSIWHYKSRLYIYFSRCHSFTRFLFGFVPLLVGGRHGGMNPQLFQYVFCASGALPDATHHWETHLHTHSSTQWYTTASLVDQFSYRGR